MAVALLALAGMYYIRNSKPRRDQALRRCSQYRGAQSRCLQSADPVT